jgi:hypothetical protein
VLLDDLKKRLAEAKKEEEGFSSTIDLLSSAGGATIIGAEGFITVGG